VPGLLTVAAEYDKRANRLVNATRTKDKDGKLLPTYQAAVEYYREMGDKVRALILPEDLEPAETEWHLESTHIAQVAAAPKVTAKDKVADPKELIAKVNG
jgi:hypothetical protein